MGRVEIHLPVRVQNRLLVEFFGILGFHLTQDEAESTCVGGGLTKTKSSRNVSAGVNPFDIFYVYDTVLL